MLALSKPENRNKKLKLLIDQNMTTDTIRSYFENV